MQNLSRVLLKKKRENAKKRLNMPVYEPETGVFRVWCGVIAEYAC
jgi:hypothetical protein